MSGNPTRRSFLRSVAAGSVALTCGLAGCTASLPTGRPPAQETRQFLRPRDLEAPVESGTDFEVYRPQAFAESSVLSRGAVPISEASPMFEYLNQDLDVELYVRNAYYHALRASFDRQQFFQKIETTEGSGVEPYNGFMIGTFRYFQIAFDDDRLLVERSTPGPSHDLKPIVDRVAGDAEPTLETATFDGLLSTVNTSYMSMVEFDAVRGERYFEGGITVQSIGQFIEPADSAVRCVSVLECQSPVTDSPESLRHQYEATWTDVQYFRYAQPTISVDGSQITFTETMPAKRVFG